MANFNVSIVEQCDACEDIVSAYVPAYGAAQFRGQFPAFADSTKFTDTQVGFYIAMAFQLLSADRWGTMLDYGVALFTAHFLALDRQALLAPGGAGIPGTSLGIVNAGTVDKVTFGKDTASIMEENAGHWGMTSYGLQFLRFSRMMGMGPVQVGADSSYGFPQAASLYAGAWPGPFSGF